MKQRMSKGVEFLKGFLLIAGLALIISIGIKWFLAIALIPLLLLLSSLGIYTSFDSEALSTGISILAFFLALAYLLYGDKLTKKD